MPERHDATRLAAPVSERDRARGPRYAPIELVEYGDYECPGCRAAHLLVHPLLDTMGRKLCFAYRHFPLAEPHPNALLAAQAAEAAWRQGRFWEMHDRLFERQDELGAEAILSWAEEFDLNLEELASAIQNGSTLPKIREDRLTGARSGVDRTPAFFVNGERYHGPLRYEPLVEALEHAAS